MDSESHIFNRCLYFSSNALSKILGKMAEEEFRILGLAPTYAYLLMLINDKPGMQPSEISEKLVLSPSTVTRLVEKMERQGYLERKSQGRATLVESTTKGRDMDDQIRNAWGRLQQRYREELGDRYGDVLTEMTMKAVEQLERIDT
ncbi:MAG: MarR family transcriptional regulator [Balneolaceae bacterium]|nr:MarR family transcriptional regulator [Balneolaceae bacterium]